ncbi:uncharacterized protein BT62DRAFT_918563 [Guyanagaster necrorhizus]|uniref:Uncharacterized protein n=1 Tax=Guyanagaster necrorhizus TaxID=856835 RepID=A0A9P8AU51_9AGAR|nr:uncharacterized protein BT62DRAFT_918563 [Guyanagaster necrorhizus MCA 3950]KAG7448113.1 hypothetical protein BT62DRAFT_918563 [Guyanagaster necrorhizus MCA 3950]
MTKFAILSALVLLCAYVPGGQAGPAMVKGQLGAEHGHPVAAIPTKVIEARQAVVTSVVGGVTSIIGGARDGLVISLGGEVTLGGLFTIESSGLSEASKAIEAEVAAITSVVGGVTSVVGGVTSVVGGVTSVVGGVTTVIGGVTSVVAKATPTP